MNWLACSGVVVMTAMAVALAGCGRKAAEGDAKTGGGRAREVVVYCSADAPVAQGVFAAFEKKTGISVKAVYDTEATKTTGLVNRLLAEHEQGKVGADVWWSSEPFGTIRLSRAGVLEKYTSASGEGEMGPAGWPRGLRGKDGDWYGFARRLRVVIYNTKHVKEEELPRLLRNLTAEKWKGRVGMARPEFGTTRGHMAAIHSLDDGKSLRNWLSKMKANGLRLFDGNATVARAVGSGELWLGLTDSDDAIIAMSNGWPVDFVPVGDVCEEMWSIRAAITSVVTGDELAPYPETPMQPPSTVAVVRGGANGGEARALVDFLISDEAGKLLSASEFHALPTVPDRGAPGVGVSKGVWSGAASRRMAGLPRSVASSELDYERVADHVEGAMGACGEVLGR